MSITMQPAGADLFASGADVLVNPVNTVGVMGAGLALQFKRRYPMMYSAYRDRCQRRLIRAGAVDLHTVCDVATGARPLFIANVATKRHWRDPSRPEWVVQGLRELSDVVTQSQAQSVALPPLGCGLGGLAWDAVHSLITTLMAPVSRAGTEVLLYPPH